MTIRAVRVSALVEDFSVYPRHAVDNTYVGRLVEALQAGEQFPPPIAEEKSYRLVDGFHRTRAYRRVLGPEAEVQVDLRKFASPADLIAAAVEPNAKHGRGLDQVDRVRCAVMLKEAGVDPERMALVLHVRPSSVEKLLLRVTPVPAGTAGAIPGTQMMSLKRAASHLTGATLTKEQAAAHGNLPGTSLTLLAKQLINALNMGFVDPHNERLHEALVELDGVLRAYLAKG